MKALALLLFLSGCASQMAAVEQAGGVALDTLEDASELGLKACFHYLGTTVRVGPLMEELDTPEKRAAWTTLFGEKSPALPD